MAEAFEKTDKDSTIIAAIAALFGGIIAILIYFLKKDDRFVRFYALQEVVFSIAAGLAMFALYMVVFGLSFALQLIGLAGTAGGNASVGLLAGVLMIVPFAIIGMAFLAYFAVKIFAVYNAFTGKTWEIPVVGKFVKQYI